MIYYYTDLLQNMIETNLKLFSLARDTFEN